MKRGVTLIEVLVVISTISLLSSITLASLGEISADSRDSVRKSDLRNIQNALEMRNLTTGSYFVPAGYRHQYTVPAGEGLGYGWFAWNTDDWTYVPSGDYSTQSFAELLYSEGYLSGVVIDPLGENEVGKRGRIPIGDKFKPGYMIWTSPESYTIWAGLEDPSTTDIATQERCTFSTWDNAYSTDPEFVSSINYCVSN